MMLPGGAGRLSHARQHPPRCQSVPVLCLSQPLAAPHPSQGGASARLAYHVAAGFPAHAVSQWRSEERQLEEEEEEEYLSSMICL